MKIEDCMKCYWFTPISEENLISKNLNKLYKINVLKLCYLLHLWWALLNDFRKRLFCISYTEQNLYIYIFILTNIFLT